MMSLKALFTISARPHVPYMEEKLISKALDVVIDAISECTDGMITVLACPDFGTEEPFVDTDVGKVSARISVVKEWRSALKVHAAYLDSMLENTSEEKGVLCALKLGLEGELEAALKRRDAPASAEEPDLKKPKVTPVCATPVVKMAPPAPVVAPKK